MAFLCNYFGVLLHLFSLVASAVCWHHPIRVMEREALVKRTALFVSLVAVMGLASCGSYKLRTLDLAVVSNANLAAPCGTAVDLKGLGGCVKLQATGNYSNFTSKDLTNRVTYQIAITAGSIAMPTPPAGATVDATGMVTATIPGVCTWTQTSANPVTWATVGTYQLTATFGNVTSNPVYLPVASAAGGAGACGP